MKVVFYKLNNGAKTPFGEVIIADGRIKATPPDLLINLLQKEEFIIGKGGKRISIKEPEPFLKNLKYAFHGSYAWAEEEG